MACGIPGKCFGASSTRPCSVAAVIARPQMTCSSLNRPMKEVPPVDHGHAAKGARRSQTRTASSIILQFSPAMEHGSFPVPIQHPFRRSFRLSFRNWQQVWSSFLFGMLKACRHKSLKVSPVCQQMAADEISRKRLKRNFPSETMCFHQYPSTYPPKCWWYRHKTCWANLVGWYIYILIHMKTNVYIIIIVIKIIIIINVIYYIHSYYIYIHR